MSAPILSDRLYNRYVPPEDIEPIAALLLVHGMVEHSGRYTDFAEFLAQHGVVVQTFDQLGHGQRAAELGDLGYMGLPDPAQRILDYTRVQYDALAYDYPDLPKFILGHSMGSFVTRALLPGLTEGQNKQLAGAILMGTSDANPLAGVFLPITRALNVIAPQQDSAVLDGLLRRVTNLPFWRERDQNHLNWLNTDREQIQRAIDDPLMMFHFSYNGFYALMELMARATPADWAQGVRRDLPMLWVSGQDDNVGQMGKALPRIVKRLREQAFSDVEYKQYMGMRHEILFDPDHAQVYDDIIGWMKQHLTA